MPSGSPRNSPAERRTSTQARTLLRSNELAVEAERRSKAVLESQELQLVADLHAKEAALAVAQVNLGYTRIVAPADGTVGERQVRPGQLVSPGTQVLSFVGGTAWVQANFRETQLTNIKVGDPVDVRVDVYPGERDAAAGCSRSRPPADRSSRSCRPTMRPATSRRSCSACRSRSRSTTRR